MTTIPLRSFGRVFALVAAMGVGCSRPEPPRITPEKATVTSITASGIDLRVRLEAYNPNSIDLSAKSVKARLVLDGKQDVGTVNVNSPIKLPAGQKTKLDVPLSMKWTSITGLATLAQQNRTIPYRVDGTIQLSGGIDIDVPFQLDGTITHDELVKATVNSLPNLGFPRH